MSVAWKLTEMSQRINTHVRRCYYVSKIKLPLPNAMKEHRAHCFARRHNLILIDCMKLLGEHRASNCFIAVSLILPPVQRNVRFSDDTIQCAITDQM